MSILFFDGFEHYDTLSQKWDTVTGSSAVSISGSAARNGSYGARFAFPNAAVALTKNLPTTTTAVLGFGFNYRSYINPSTVIVATFLDGSTTQVDLRVDITGHFVVTRNGTVLGTSSLAISFNTWNFIEFKATIDPSAGVAEVKVNGVSFLSLTSQNTRATANSSFGALVLGTLAGWQGTYDIDDVYLLNNSGSFNNTYLGDSRVEAALPTANGTTNNFTRGGADSGNNWDQVNENPPTDDSDYVVSATAGDIDRYTYPALATTSGTVCAVSMTIRARKNDAGVRTIRGAIKSGATVADTGVDLAPPQSAYAYFQAFSETDPNTSAAWTLANVNSAEFGVKVTA